MIFKDLPFVPFGVAVILLFHDFPLSGCSYRLAVLICVGGELVSLLLGILSAAPL
jgi:hypothetical protein